MKKGSDVSLEKERLSEPKLRLHAPHVRFRSARFFVSLVGTVLCVVALGFFGQTLFAELGSISRVEWRTSVLISIVAAILFYSFAMLSCAIVWFFMVGSTNSRISWAAALRVYLASQLAKYIPGNLAQHVGRVTLAKRYGLPGTLVAATIAAEAALVIFAATIVSVMSLTLDSHWTRTGTSMVPSFSSLTILVVLLAGGCFVAIRLARKWLPQWADNISRSDRQLLHAAVGFVLVYIATFGIHGLNCGLLAWGVFGSTELHLAAATGVFAVAWTAGFLTPGAPAGIGVREAVLVFGFTPLYGETTAVGLAGLLRVVSLFGDGLAFLIGILLPRKNSSVEAINSDASTEPSLS